MFTIPFLGLLSNENVCISLSAIATEKKIFIILRGKDLFTNCIHICPKDFMTCMDPALAQYSLQVHAEGQGVVVCPVTILSVLSVAVDEARLSCVLTHLTGDFKSNRTLSVDPFTPGERRRMDSAVRRVTRLQTLLGHPLPPYSPED